MREVQVCLGAFGKHPGWNDHIDDLGLDTPALAALKRGLYFDGVAANIDQGRWEQLEEDKRLPGFEHEFILRDHGAWFAGRMWHSRDGKNRRRYPMVLVLQAVQTPLVWILQEGMPRLEKLAEKCRGTEEAAVVIQDVENARRWLRSSQADDAEQGTVMPEWLEAENPYLDLARHEELGSGREGWYRFRYRLARECGPCLRGARADRAGPQPQHLRVPACWSNPGRSLLTWYGALDRLFQPEVPLMLVRPIGLSWVDVLIGPAGPRQYYCLLANLAALPAVSEMPFNVEEAFRQQVDEELVTWDQPQHPLLLAALSTGIPRIQKKKGLFRGLFR